MNDFLNENLNPLEPEDSPATPKAQPAEEPAEINTTEEQPVADVEEPASAEALEEEPTEIPLESEPLAEEIPPISAPVYNPVNITPVKPVTDYKPMSKGLKVFALVMVAIIALTSASLAGYYVGKNGTPTLSQNHVSIDLENPPEDAEEMSAAGVYEQLNKSIVGITVYNSAGSGSQASGIVYSNDGYIVTNDHIYSEVANPKFKIHTFDGKEYDATYVAGDLISDLAVLKIETSSLEAATFGNSDKIYTGQRVVAIGRPDDATDSSSITQGIISAVNRRVKNSSNYSARLIQTDSPINPGSSGGALVNMYGQVVGITSSKLASVEYEGVGYAIPTTVMKRIVEELITEGKVVSRAKLGITYAMVNSVNAEINGYDYTGLLVDSVTEDSDLYGKISKGDMIIKINNTEITNDDTVLDIIESCTAGDTITVTVVTSEDETKDLKVKLLANVGDSSYTTKETLPQYSDDEDEDYSDGGTFDFPFGE